MAIARLRQGGVGVLHRNLSVEEQAQQVDTVEAVEAGMIMDPVTCGSRCHHRGRGRRCCGQFRISGVPVISEDGILQRHREGRYIRS